MNTGALWQVGPLAVEPGHTLRGVYPVDLGAAQINFPIALINGTRPDPVILVTAGMDGDEYSGIEAALRLIDALDPAELNGRVMVCPILDPLSFEALQRQNPLDGLFLKHVFPGSLDGKPTQRLAHFVYTYFITAADAWIDLQATDVIGDAIPFVWTSRVQDDEINDKNRALLAHSGAQIGLLTAPQRWEPLEEAATVNTALLAVQAGRRYRTEEDAVNYHLEVIRSILGAFQMLPPSNEAAPAPRVFLDVESVLAEHTGVWHPYVKAGDVVQRGQSMGELSSLDGNTVLQHVTATVNGTVLAVQTGLAARPRLGLALIAHRAQQPL